MKPQNKLVCLHCKLHPKLNNFKVSQNMKLQPHREKKKVPKFLKQHQLPSIFTFMKLIKTQSICQIDYKVSQQIL